MPGCLCPIVQSWVKLFYIHLTSVGYCHQVLVDLNSLTINNTDKFAGSRAVVGYISPALTPKNITGTPIDAGDA